MPQEGRWWLEAGELLVAARVAAACRRRRRRRRRAEGRRGRDRGRQLFIT
jgi:hypothetical protein